MITSFPGRGITVEGTCSTMGVACPLRLVVLRVQDGSRGTVKDNDVSLYQSKGDRGNMKEETWKEQTLFLLSCGLTWGVHIFLEEAVSKCPFQLYDWKIVSLNSLGSKSFILCQGVLYMYQGTHSVLRAFTALPAFPACLLRVSQTFLRDTHNSAPGCGPLKFQQHPADLKAPSGNVFQDVCGTGFSHLPFWLSWLHCFG